VFSILGIVIVLVLEIHKGSKPQFFLDTVRISRSNLNEPTPNPFAEEVQGFTSFPLHFFPLFPGETCHGTKK